MLSRSRMVIILLLLVFAAASAQFYEYGQDPGKLHWNQFRTPHYRFIFPREADSLARAYAIRAEHYYSHIGAPLDHQHSTMPVVVHNQASFSNGVFVWAPKRLEIFTNPDPNGFGQDWLTQLALHEGRHAVQIDKLNQGFTRALSVLGGQQFSGAMAVFLPYWYLEGDAVDSETRLSPAGRGRSPSFEMQLKAQMLEADKIYSYTKAYLGSYRHYIPDYYQLGYLMVRHGRRTHGDGIWTDYQLNAARKPFLLNPGWFALRKYGYRNKADFYKEALVSYRSHWESGAARRWNTTEDFHSSDPGKHYTSYRYPVQLEDGSLLAYKNGMDQIPEFVRIDTMGREERLHRPGFLNTGRSMVSGKLLCWDEFVVDTRWSNRNYSLIHLLDLESGKHRTLGKKTRYYSPALSRDGSRLAVIEQGVDGNADLLILNTGSDGRHRIRPPGQGQLQEPAWMEKDTALVAFFNTREGKDLYSYSLKRNRWQKLSSGKYEQMSDPLVRGDSIFFSASFSGIDNIYCYILSTSKVLQLTSVSFGAFQPSISPDGSRLFYSSYHSQGYRLASLELEKALWKPLGLARDHSEQLDYGVGPGVEVPGFTELPADALDSLSSSRPYRKVLNLFNFHSWLPAYFDYLEPELSIDPEDLPISLGFSLISQNLLSTAVSQLAWEYKDGYHYLHTGMQLKGRYPVLNLYMDYGGVPDIHSVSDDSLSSLPVGLGFRANTYIPFRINTGKYLTLIQPGISYRYNRDVEFATEGDDYKIGLHQFTGSIYATSYLRTGVRDIWPRFGINMNAIYSLAPFSEYVSPIGYARASVYIPGIMRHHSIKLSAHYQQQEFRVYAMNITPVPRGLGMIVASENRMLTADYVFPLMYPDLAIGPFAYIKRIRAGLWTDYMETVDSYVLDPSPHFEDKAYHTAGADLLFDFNVLRIPFDISAGGRFYYDMKEGFWGLEFLASIDLP